MAAVPAATPVTSPEASTVAIEALPVNQAPPVVASDKVVMLPVHTVVAPVMAAGAAGTVVTVMPVVA